jgi:hypothetical protein
MTKQGAAVVAVVLAAGIGGYAVFPVATLSDGMHTARLPRCWTW